MRKPIQIALVVLAAPVLAIYTGDYVWLRLRATYPRLGPAFGTVRMERLYAIELKSGKTEYELDAQQPEVTLRCVRALLPHLGEKPCWYLERQSQKPIPI